MPARKPQPEKPVQKRILLVDDHALLRRGLTSLIETEPDLMVCAEAATRRAGLAAVASSKPDLVIADISLQDGDSDGLEMIRDIHRRHPGLPVLALSTHGETEYAERALRAGARGYVSKADLDTTVLLAIRRLLAGDIHTSDAMGRKLTQKLMDGGTLQKGAGLDALSNRELEVFKLIGDGRTTREIATSLSLSVKTIDSYREHLKSKLGLSTGVQLARRATLWVEIGRTG